MMNISKIVRSAKCGVLGALVAMGLTATAANPTVTVGEVKAGEPWSTITVNYTLGGTDAKTDYKVAFDVTAGGKTAGVTNDAAKVENKGYSQEIDTAALFGAATPDTKAKVKVSLIALKPFVPPAGQLWKGGPIWAECNIGATKPEEYGILTNFNDAAQAVTDALGADWRLPSDVELKILAGENDDGDKVCSNVWTTCNGVAGCRFFGMTSGYEDKSIFLPATGFGSGDGRKGAGRSGRYWPSEEIDDDLACILYFYEGCASMDEDRRSRGLSVRAVRGSAE